MCDAEDPCSITTAYEREASFTPSPRKTPRLPPTFVHCFLFYAWLSLPELQSTCSMGVQHQMGVVASVRVCLHWRQGRLDGPAPTGPIVPPAHAGKTRILSPLSGGVSLQPSKCCLHLGYRRRRGTITAPASRKGARPQTRNEDCPRDRGPRPPTHSSTMSSTVTSKHDLCGTNGLLRMATDCRVAVLKRQRNAAPHTCELKGSIFAVCKAR